MKTRRATSLTNDLNQYNETSDITTKQAVKKQQNAWQAPYVQPLPDQDSAPSATPRHRRSDKYRADAAPQMPAAEQEQVQPAPAYDVPQVTRAPRYDEQDAQMPTPRRSRADENYDDADDEDDYEPIRIWPRVLAAVVLIALAVCIALYFVPNAGPLQPVKYIP